MTDLFFIICFVMTDDTISRNSEDGLVVYGANGLETSKKRQGNQEAIGVRSPTGDRGCLYHGWIHTVV